MSNERGTYDTVKSFGERVLVVGGILTIGVLALRHAMEEQRLYVETVNLYQPGTSWRSK